METVKICVGGREIEVGMGSVLREVADKIGVVSYEGKEARIIAALVDHKLKSLDYRVFNPHDVEFVSYLHQEGRRTYLRSLCFLLQRAVRGLYPTKVLEIDHSLPSGFYCTFKDERVGESEVLEIREEMRRLVAADIPFLRRKMHVEDAGRLFLSQGQPMKAGLQDSLGRFYCSVYFLDGVADSFHGPLVPSTGYLNVFDLVPFHHGFCLQYPMDTDADRLIPRVKQMKLTGTLKEYAEWCRTTGIQGVGSLNRCLLEGRAIELINLCEARQERGYAEIADKIFAERDRIKIVFLAGPSSSGKTSSALRLAQQLKVLGMTPKVVELDNYFVERDRTPRDEKGEFDFEALGAMDLDLLGQHLNALLAGETVEIPRYDFKAGQPRFEGNMMHLDENDILVMEGIHALDPEMVPSVDQTRIFRVYASALTSLKVDENCVISTSDNRLLRRMVRDNRVRGIIPENTILRWPSVRRGEQKNIFPFQENADAQFNSALLYELPLLKYYAEPLLSRILPSSPAYAEAVRLLKFLRYVVALTPEEVAAIPPTSILREFIGAQTL